MYYFAYASNLSRQQMQQRCPGGKPLFKATLPNYKLLFSGYSRLLHSSKATIQLNRGEKVLGGVYEVSDQELKKLASFEQGYSQLNVNVFDEDGEQHEAVTFIKTAREAEGKPSPEYLSTIQQGYKDWRII